MLVSFLLPLYLTFADLASATPAQLATMDSLTGEWGFVGSDNPNRDLVQKPGRCGEPSALVINIDRETPTDGVAMWRLHAGVHDQHGGRVTGVESTAGVQRVTVEFFGPIESDTDIFEISGDRLTVIAGTVHTQVERCAP